MYRAFLKDLTLADHLVSGIAEKQVINLNAFITKKDHLMDSQAIKLLKTHWSRLGTSGQKKIVVQSFYHLFLHHSHMRPMWAFGRRHIDDFDQMKLDATFRNHVNNVHAALNLLVMHLEKPKWFKHLLQDIGSRHFFYDAMEPHYDIFQEALILSFREAGATNSLQFNPDLEQAWNQAFEIIKLSMQIGINDSRTRYLQTCVTEGEICDVRELWQAVKNHGLQEAGVHLCRGALTTYQSLVREYHPDGEFQLQIDSNSDAFQTFATDTIAAVETTISSYQPSDGFVKLPEKLSPYVEAHLSEGLSPILVRKALMEGFISMLTYVLGEVTMSQTVQRVWLKIYRVMEQSIVHNLVHM